MNVVDRIVEQGVRARVFTPKGPGRWPAVIAYSDIFQHTPPHVRMCTRIASYGFTVIAPELYRGIEPPGTVLRFEEDRQRALDDSAKLKLEDFEHDLDSALKIASSESDRIFACGWCIGGHLAFRAALRPEVKATVCFYATGLHTDSVGAATGTSRALDAAKTIKGQLLLVWGARDPHVPADGRALIHRRLGESGIVFQTRTYDAEHAFMRDEGPRWEPRLADLAFGDLIALFSS